MLEARLSHGIPILEDISQLRQNRMFLSQTDPPSPIDDRGSVGKSGMQIFDEPGVYRHLW